MINHEELYDLDVCPDLAVDGHAILELMGEALAYVPSYTERHARGLALYKRHKAGEVLHVQTPEGKRLEIHPAYWETLVLGFSLQENGKAVPGYQGKMIGASEMKDWLSELIEIVQQ